MGRENRADDEGKGAEGIEDTGERERKRRRSWRMTKRLEPSCLPWLLVLSLFHHHRGCVVRKSHAHDCSLHKYYRVKDI